MLETKCEESDSGRCPLIARVAVHAATYWIDRPYDYRIPHALRDRAVPGVRVTVPFSRGNRRTEGLILSVCEEPGCEEQVLKTIDCVLDEEPVLSTEFIQLAVWMRERFFCTVYEAVRAMLPAGLWYSMTPEYRITPGTDRETAYEAAGHSAMMYTILDAVYARRGRGCTLRELQDALDGADPGRAVSELVRRGVLTVGNQQKRRVGDKREQMLTLAVTAEEAMEYAARKKRRAPMQASILELLSAAGRVSGRELLDFTGASPQSLRALTEAGLVGRCEEEVFRRPSFDMGERQELPILNEEQREAFEGLLRHVSGIRAGAALLFGVTGSGKTAVYIHLIDHVLRKGESAILLVPEIALTPQMLRTFSSHFGDEIAVLHSSLAIGERYDEWKRIRAGKAHVVVGTRSAVFAPVENLGLIIMDEEQEHTYKSENAPRYHARDIAKYRCARRGKFLVLGSATPDIDSRYRAQTGAYAFFTLSTRYNRQSLPSVEIVDMKKELRAGNGSCVSGQLYDSLRETMERGEQSILFLNRRGASKLITCSACGYVYACPNCSVSLTWHSTSRRLLCHYCGHSHRVDECCPSCGGRLNYIGVGTQKLETDLQEHFPGTSILRMDTDSVQPAGSHAAMLERFRREKIPILVGTQMVTKGLDFENVTLVGVISADQSLYCGDFRASERTFSLLTQVIGRSGRGKRPGRAVIQTFTPENQVILQAAAQDYESFYASELKLRLAQRSPPITDILALTASGPDENLVLRCCDGIRSILRRELEGAPGVRILGPAPLPVVRVNNRFRYRVTLTCQSDIRIRLLISNILTHFNTSGSFRGVSVYADNNPYD